MRALLDARQRARLAVEALRLGRLVACGRLLDEVGEQLGDAIRREAELRREIDSLRSQLAAKDRAGARLDPAVTRTSGLLAIEINKGA